MLRPTANAVKEIAFSDDELKELELARKREIVFDAFGGSGSTLMACEQLNRISYNTELSENYCDVIVKRFAKEFGVDGIYLERDGKMIDIKDTKIL